MNATIPAEGQCYGFARHPRLSGRIDVNQAIIVEIGAWQAVCAATTALKAGTTVSVVTEPLHALRSACDDLRESVGMPWAVASDKTSASAASRASLASKVENYGARGWGLEHLERAETSVLANSRGVEGLVNRSASEEEQLPDLDST